MLSVSRIEWNDCLTNLDVSNRLLGPGSENILSQAYLTSLVGLRVANGGYSPTVRCPIFRSIHEVKGATWQRGVTKCVLNLVGVGVSFLRGWGP